jgi:2-desacetyl-2-hydroxyethyl bacteriochlorophyllide A dehydrogenase
MALPTPASVPPVPKPWTKASIFSPPPPCPPYLLQDFLAGGRLMVGGIQRVLELPGEKIARILRRDFLRHADAGLVIAGTVEQDQFRAELADQLAAFFAGPCGHQDRDGIPKSRADHRQGDAGVAAAAFENDRIGPEQAASLGIEQDVLGEAIFKEKVELHDEPMPRPGPRQLLVQLTRTLISTGTEGIVFTRNFGPGTHWDSWVKYPFFPGYLSAGRVVEVGSDVTGWNIGDRVASRSNHTSHALVDVAGTSAGSHAGEAAFTPWNIPVRIPDAVPDEDACWMGLGKIVQVGFRRAEHVLGDSVVVVGLGLLGQLVVQYARLSGAENIIAIDTAPARLKMAAAHGATHTLEMTAGDALPEVERITAGRRADVVYDVTGHPAVLAAALPLARRFGLLMLLGDAGTPSLQTLTPDIITRGVRIQGAHDSFPPVLPTNETRWSALQMFELFLTYLARGQMRVGDLITHHYKPAQAAEAYAMLQKERLTAMGVEFDWM